MMNIDMVVWRLLSDPTSTASSSFFLPFTSIAVEPIIGLASFKIICRPKPGRLIINVLFYFLLNGGFPPGLIFAAPEPGSLVVIENVSVRRVDIQRMP